MSTTASTGSHQTSTKEPPKSPKSQATSGPSTPRQVKEMFGSGKSGQTASSIMEQHDFIEAKDKPRLEEGLKIRDLFSQMDKDVIDGSQWFLLP